MKKIISVLMIIILTTAITGCSQDKKDNKTPPETKAQVVKSDNETHLSYEMNIEEFTDKFNTMYEEKTGEGIVEDKNQKMISLDKDNLENLEKNFYSYSAKYCQLIFEINEKSENIISITTATTGEVWKENADKVMEIGTVASIVGAGYSLEDYKFMKKLYQTSISGNCYFDNVVYKIIGTDSSDDMIVKMMSLPSDKKAIENTQYTDYLKYVQKKCRFNEH